MVHRESLPTALGLQHLLICVQKLAQLVVQRHFGFDAVRGLFTLDVFETKGQSNLEGNI